MSDLITRLEEIRALGGREPLPDPTKIQDFGEPPPPPYQVREREPGDIPEPDWTNPQIDLGEGEDPFEEARIDSPLIPRVTLKDAPGQPIPQAPAITLDLAIASSEGKCAASLMGRQVALTPGEEAQVKAIIIKALRRDLNEQFPLRQRKRTKKTAESAPVAGQGGTSLPTPPSPKRRGRPKKVRQHLDGSETKA